MYFCGLKYARKREGVLGGNFELPSNLKIETGIKI